MVILVKKGAAKKQTTNQKNIFDFTAHTDNDVSDGPKGTEEPNKKDPVNIDQRPHRMRFYLGTDPLDLAEVLRKIVCKGNSRKYYRFRGGRFYGGIAAADCLGCILDCVFCWSYKPRCNPEGTGKFYSPKEVVEKLVHIAEKNNYDKLRITGNEPTLCKEHLLDVLGLIPNNFLFILETNGILLDKSYVDSFKPFKNRLHVRVSLKAVTPKQFEHITGMSSKFVDHPFRALKYLKAAGISSNVAIMDKLVDESNMRVLFNKLDTIDNRLARELELESLMVYPFIETELTQRGLNKNFKPI